MRSRHEHESWLSRRIAESQDERVTAVLASALESARAFERSAVPLGTLARLVEACDEILSGRAGALAEPEQIETEHLLPGRTPLNSVTIGSYVRLRARLDRKVNRDSEWTGPADATVRRSETLRPVVQALRDAELVVRRKPVGSRSRRIEEIIGAIEPIEARQEMRFELERGRRAEKQLQILQKGLANRGVDLSSLLTGAEPTASGSVNPVSGNRTNDEEAQMLAQFRVLLLDNDQLRQFELINDGSRIKLNRSPSTALFSKKLLDALLALLDKRIG